MHFMASHFTSLKIAAVVSFVVFYSTLVSSITLYRISPFHPLYKYPGPFSAKVTKLWNIWIMAGGKNHVCYKKLHDKYGPYVRIGSSSLFWRDRLSYERTELGPNELSVTDVTAIPSILGMNGMPKGPSAFNLPVHICLVLNNHYLVQCGRSVLASRTDDSGAWSRCVASMNTPGGESAGTEHSALTLWKSTSRWSSGAPFSSSTSSIGSYWKAIQTRKSLLTSPSGSASSRASVYSSFSC